MEIFLKDHTTKLFNFPSAEGPHSSRTARAKVRVRGAMRQPKRRGPGVRAAAGLTLLASGGFCPQPGGAVRRGCSQIIKFIRARPGSINPLSLLGQTLSNSVVGTTVRQWAKKSQLTLWWQTRQISNFEYLMQLNTLAGPSGRRRRPRGSDRPHD